MKTIAVIKLTFEVDDSNWERASDGKLEKWCDQVTDLGVDFKGICEARLPAGSELRVVVEE